ncbi:MAG: hypothetical protein HY746_05650 [Elusimicrobia bacterium]|nr:hypothetical protein [Elusimicrobiota bacterium]
MPKTMKLILTAVFFIFPFLTRASDFNDPKFYTIVEVSGEITLVGEKSGLPLVPELNVKNSAAKTGPAAAGAIVNTGAALWNVITNGAPSGSAASAYASAVPGWFFSWPNFIEWKGPKEIQYEVKMKNLYRMTVIHVIYAISFYYGGVDNKQEYKGNYIANFTVRPLKVKIWKGFNFSLQTKMSDPMNIGTKDNPVAYLQSDLNWMYSTPFKAEGGTWIYGIDGNGNFKELTDPEFKAGPINLPQLETELKEANVSWE